VSPREIVKTLIYETEKGLVAVAMRGDREVNEVKLDNADSDKAAAEVQDGLPTRNPQSAVDPSDERASALGGKG
jgi:DNA-binding protein YbaB